MQDTYRFYPNIGPPSIRPRREHRKADLSFLAFDALWLPCDNGRLLTPSLLRVSTKRLRI